jgi:hypothetical protein
VKQSRTNNNNAVILTNAVIAGLTRNLLVKRFVCRGLREILNQVQPAMTRHCDFVFWIASCSFLTVAMTLFETAFFGVWQKLVSG